MKLTKEREKDFRAALAAFLTAAGNINVFADRPLINSKEDFVAQFFKPESVHAGGSVVKYGLVEFGRFENLDTGCADDPDVLAHYRLHIFIEFYGSTGASADNSTNELAGIVLDLRALLFNGPELTLSDGSVHSINPLGQTEFIVNSADTLTGIEGHYADLEISIEVTQ